MEFIIEKIGMSRTIGVPSVPVTLLKVIETKVCEVREDGKALVAYNFSKKLNKSIEGQQKKFGLSKEFNKFMPFEWQRGLRQVTTAPTLWVVPSWLKPPSIPRGVDFKVV